MRFSWPSAALIVLAAPLSGGGLQSHWSFNVGSVISLGPARSLLPGQQPRATSR